MQAVHWAAALGLFPFDVHVGFFVELCDRLEDGAALDIRLFVALGHFHLLAEIFERDGLEFGVFLRHHQMCVVRSGEKLISAQASFEW